MILARKAGRDVIVVIRSAEPDIALEMRTEPLDVCTAIMLCSRLTPSLTPGRVEPASRERLDTYSEMPSTPAMRAWLLNRPSIKVLDREQVDRSTQGMN